MGNPGCILVVGPETSFANTATLLDILSRMPRGIHESSPRGWSAWLDPEGPPTQPPLTHTASDAVFLHRIRMRACYERYLRTGGNARG